MLPRLGSSKLVSAWIWTTLAVSIVAAIDGGLLDAWLSLAPAKIWHGQLWRLVTWVFVEPSPWRLALTCLAIYKFGGELAVRWGDRRLRRFILELVAAASVGTAMVALVSRDVWAMHRIGSWIVDDALVIAWARQFFDAPLQLYGLVKLSGKRLIAVSVAITATYALFGGPLLWSPELIGCAIAYWYPKAWLMRR